MNTFSIKKTVVLTKEEKRKISSKLKAMSLSREEMEKLIIDLEETFSICDKAASNCSKKYQSAINRRSNLREETQIKRKEISEKIQKEIQNIKSENIGIIGTIFRNQACKDRDTEIARIQKRKEQALTEIAEWERTERANINSIISATYELEGKKVNGGKYWHTMRHRAVTAKAKISALKKLVTKSKKDEQLLELKASASENHKKTRTLASPVKSRIREQFKVLEHCPYCGRKIDKKSAHADHIYPVSKGGQSSPKNMVYICSNCNLTKGNKTLNQFIKERNFQRTSIEQNLELLNKDF